MRKLIKVVLISTFVFATAASQGQAPYKMGIGGVLGTMEGVSFKMFVAPKLAFQTELAFKWGTYPFGSNGYHFSSWLNTLELNPNLFYQRTIKSWNAGRLDWLVGGGVSIGCAFGRGYYGYVSSAVGKFGVNAGGGVEFTFSKIPLALQTDFRPGYGLLFDANDHVSYFDWSVNISARYCFGK